MSATTSGVARRSTPSSAKVRASATSISPAVFMSVPSRSKMTARTGTAIIMREREGLDENSSMDAGTRRHRIKRGARRYRQRRHLVPQGADRGLQEGLREEVPE